MTSPAIVEVPRSGEYGIALVVRSGVGLGDEPPRDGDVPSAVIVVDDRPPDVRLLGADQGGGSRGPLLTIAWQSQDEHPLPGGTTLLYAAGPNGPWQPIETGLEPNGRYEWLLPRGTPARIYLRVEVADAAGNVQTVDTPQPVAIDLAKPKARILKIGPGR
jgi:hypothetical protein